MTTLRNILPEQVLVDILSERFQVSCLLYSIMALNIIIL